MVTEPTVLAGKYRLTSLLGRGGMGAVWRAEHLGFSAPVAVKLIDAKAVDSREALRRFHNEARAAAALRSPHVVQILDYGIDEPLQIPFIAMELLEGESLALRLSRSGKMPLLDTITVVTHVARALSRAHEIGIVHRDLKPDNIFLVRNDDEEVAKVLDFGIAHIRQRDAVRQATTQAGALLGTPHYMSPEQISGAKVDHRGDLWALGVIACECVLGRRLFSAADIGQLVLEICSLPMPVPSRLGAVPAGFDAWFARATARAPDRRFQSARQLADELRAVCLGADRPSLPSPRLSAAGAPREQRRASTDVPPTVQMPPETMDTTSKGSPVHLSERAARPEGTAARPARLLWVLVGMVAAGVTAAGFSLVVPDGQPRSTRSTDSTGSRGGSVSPPPVIVAPSPATSPPPPVIVAPSPATSPPPRSAPSQSSAPQPSGHPSSLRAAAVGEQPEQARRNREQRRFRSGAPPRLKPTPRQAHQPHQPPQTGYPDRTPLAPSPAPANADSAPSSAMESVLDQRK